MPQWDGSIVFATLERLAPRSLFYGRFLNESPLSTIRNRRFTFAAVRRLDGRVDCTCLRSNQRRQK